MHLAELSGADQLTQLVARHRAFDASRDRWWQSVDTQRREVRPEAAAHELVDVNGRVEPDDFEPPE
jgi:hypothetical protein